MSAYRKLVPLREANGIFKSHDGTMCRMPSPLPGPLRNEWRDEGFHGDGAVYEKSHANIASEAREARPNLELIHGVQAAAATTGRVA
jgi:hypothetical protein